MHRAAVWQHNINSNIKIGHNFTEHFLWNPSDFSADNVLTCLCIVFTNSVFQVSLQKIVRQVEILGIGWPGVVCLRRNESVPWEVKPELFKCSVLFKKWGVTSFLEQDTYKYAYISLKQQYKTPVKKDLMRIILFRTYELLKLYIILCIFHVLISFDIYQTIHSFPNKFQSLSSKFRKCF